jgi:hypothetical protein
MPADKARGLLTCPRQPAVALVLRGALQDLLAACATDERLVGVLEAAILAVA